MTRQSSPDYITIGSRKDDVARIQGPPDSTTSFDTFEGESWGYGSGNTFCSISFNRAGRVEGWFNRGDVKVRMVPGSNATTSSSFSINSHKDDVARLEGTPYRVDVPVRQTRASLQEERRSNRELGIKPDEDDEVIKDDISGLNREDDRETWYFQGGTVEFSISTSRVTAWGSTDRAFNALGRKTPAPASGAELFTLGSSRDLIARLQGQPQSKSPIRYLGEEDWRYPGGTVKFHSTSGKVIYWENRDGSLKAKGIRPDVNTYDFNRGRKARLDAWTRQGERKTHRNTLFTFMGCLGIVVVVIVIIASCGAVLA